MVAAGRARYGVAAFVAGLLFVTVVPACGGLSSDCRDYCEKVHECLVNDLSVDSCEDTCHDWADGHDDREAKVDKCADCISKNDDTCSETSRCLGECAVIPTGQ